MSPTSSAASKGAAFSLLLSLLLLSGCGGDDSRTAPEEAEQSQEAMAFSVDSDLLGELVRQPELSISLRPPAGWEESATPTDSELPVRVLEFFQGAGPSYLLIGSIETEETAEAMAETLAHSEDQLATFSHHDLLFHQVRRVTEDRVTFSLLFDHPPEFAPVGLVQYTIPLDEIEYRARLVESSIGSIQPMGASKSGTE